MSDYFADELYAFIRDGVKVEQLIESSKKAFGCNSETSLNEADKKEDSKSKGDIKPAEMTNEPKKSEVEKKADKETPDVKELTQKEETGEQKESKLNEIKVQLDNGEILDLQTQQYSTGLYVVLYKNKRLYDQFGLDISQERFLNDLKQGKIKGIKVVNENKEQDELESAVKHANKSEQDAKNKKEVEKQKKNEVKEGKNSVDFVCDGCGERKSISKLLKSKGDKNYCDKCAQEKVENESKAQDEIESAVKHANKSEQDAKNKKEVEKGKKKLKEDYKSDEDIEKEFANFKILKIDVKPSGSSGWIDIEFPEGDEHVGGGTTDVSDNWIKYPNGKIAFGNWYPEKVYLSLVNAIKDKISPLNKNEGRVPVNPGNVEKPEEYIKNLTEADTVEKVVAAGITDETVARDLASRKRGTAVQDPQSKLWKVTVKESKIKEDTEVNVKTDDKEIQVTEVPNGGTQTTVIEKPTAVVATQGEVEAPVESPETEGEEKEDTEEEPVVEESKCQGNCKCGKNESKVNEKLNAVDYIIVDESFDKWIIFKSRGSAFIELFTFDTVEEADLKAKEIARILGVEYKGIKNKKNESKRVNEKKFQIIVDDEVIATYRKEENAKKALKDYNDNHSEMSGKAKIKVIESKNVNESKDDFTFGFLKSVIEALKRHNFTPSLEKVGDFLSKLEIENLDAVKKAVVDNDARTFAAMINAIATNSPFQLPEAPTPVAEEPQAAVKAETVKEPALEPKVSPKVEEPELEEAKKGLKSIKGIKADKLKTIEKTKNESKVNEDEEMVEPSMTNVEDENEDMEEGPQDFELTEDLLAEILEEFPELNDFDIEEVKKGIEVEKEHLDVTEGCPFQTALIALAHLKEIPDYYTRLLAMEEEAKAEAAGEDETSVEGENAEVGEPTEEPVVEEAKKCMKK